LKKFAFSIFCFFLLGVGACRNEKKSLPSDVIATVAEVPITVKAFQGEMVRRRSHIDALEQKEALLDQMVRSRTLYVAAQKEGYSQDPEILARLRQLIAGKYKQDKLDPQLEKITISDQEIEVYYTQHQTDFTTPKKVRAAIIYLALPHKASEETKTQLAQRVEAARTEALALDPETSTFGSVAVTYSDDQATRYRGGDIGWLSEGAVNKNSRRPEKIIEAIFSLTEPGQVSPIITTTEGYYLAKLVEVRQSTPQPLTQVKDRIRYTLLRQKKERIEAEFYEKLKKKIPVQINKSLLPKIKSPGEGTGDKKNSPPALPRG